MSTVSIAEAKAHFSQLVDRVAAGDEITITRRGKLVAKLVASERVYEKVDIELLRSAAAGSGKQMEDAGEFMSRIRDEERY